MSPSKARPRQPDSTQLARQWALLRLLGEGHRAYSVRELADQLGTSKLTIARDLATLEKQFALVEETAGRQKRVYRLSNHFKNLEQLRFGAMELLSLYASRTALAPASGAPFFSDLARLIAKVRGAIGAKQNGAIDALANVFLPHTRRFVDYRRHAEQIDLLVDAIARRLACRVTYRAGGRKSAREHVVHPLRLVFHDGALYAVCRFAEKGQVGTLAVHRLVDAEPTGSRFVPPRIDLEEWARSAFGIFQGGKPELVEALFAKDLSWLAEERIFHPDEKKERLADGRIRYRVRTAARGEVVSWVLRFGGKVELVRPTAWREEVAERSGAMAEAHR